MSNSSEKYNDIVTDESWIYQYDPETKRRSTVDHLALPCWIVPNQGQTSLEMWKSQQGLVLRFQWPHSHHTPSGSKYCNLEVVYRFLIPKSVRIFEELNVQVVLEIIDAPSWQLVQPPSRLHIEFSAWISMAFPCISVLPHPRNSLDLDPCGFFLFPRVKEPLRGRHFQFPD